jgi:hypothetical protein
MFLLKLLFLGLMLGDLSIDNKEPKVLGKMRMFMNFILLR